MTDDLRIFIAQHANDDVNRLALQSKSYPHISREDMIFALQQIEGRQKAQSKIPSFCQCNDILYPQRLSMEQCSSEQTARYKADLIKTLIANTLPNKTGTTFADLTGGFGIDTYFISQQFSQSHYVEQNSELCHIAQHNFQVLNSNITIHNQNTSDFLQLTPPIDVIFIDPARRNSQGKKMVLLQDCEPNIIELRTLIRQKSSLHIVKMSPMIDIHQAISILQPTELHIVATDNECKEVLAVCPTHQPTEPENITLKAVNLLADNKKEEFVFTLSAESHADVIYASDLQHYIYEPNAAIMKAGAFKSVGQYYNIPKLAPNTHLYTSDNLISDFPGRIFEIQSTDIKSLSSRQANILTRNYPLSSPQLQAQLFKKHHIKPGGTDYIIGTTIGTRHVLIHAIRIH